LPPYGTAGSVRRSPAFNTAARKALSTTPSRELPAGCGTPAFNSLTPLTLINVSTAKKPIV
jgi:hypothetical protein